MKRAFLVGMAAALVGAVSAAAAPASAATAHGVVVGRTHGALLVASGRGTVLLTRGQAAVGSRVLVRGGRVVASDGRARSAVIRGVVVRGSNGLTFLSAARHLLVVHTAARRIASAGDTEPAPGTVVQQTVTFDDQGNLDDQGEQQLGQSGQVQIQAQVAAVGTGTVTLTVNGQQLTIPLPAGLTLPSSLVGTQVTLNLSFANGQTTADEQGDSDQQGSDEQGDASQQASGSQQSGSQQTRDDSAASNGEGD